MALLPILPQIIVAIHVCFWCRLKRQRIGWIDLGQITLLSIN